MSKKKRARRQRKTLLVVGEGHTEVAFLSYLKTLYCRGANSVSVKVENAHGKGPENVLNTALRMQKRASYDGAVAVLDTDIPWTAALERKAKNNDVKLIGNNPSIEALFLALLGRKPPLGTAQCKEAVASLITVNLLDKNSYESWCTKEKLEKLRQLNKELNNLLEMYEGVEAV